MNVPLSFFSLKWNDRTAPVSGLLWPHVPPFPSTNKGDTLFRMTSNSQYHKISYVRVNHHKRTAYSSINIHSMEPFSSFYLLVDEASCDCCCCWAFAASSSRLSSAICLRGSPKMYCPLMRPNMAPNARFTQLEGPVRRKFVLQEEKGTQHERVKWKMCGDVQDYCNFQHFFPFLPYLSCDAPLYVVLSFILL